MTFSGVPSIRREIAAGVVPMPGSGTNSYTVAVTFPVGRFTTPPTVTTDSESAAIISTSHEQTTTAGCIVHAFWTDELAHSGGGAVTWTAVNAP